MPDRKPRAKTTVKPARNAGAGARRIPLRITDTTLRDAHQSLWATRMRTRDIVGVLDTIDAAGFYSLEVWGGATFDVCLRFLRENPWERLRLIKSRARKTPLQMLLRGQNILGYQHYPDDLLDRFVALSCRNGMDIFRIFDALNDNRNMEYAIKAVKRHGGHAQGTLCYTISPVHTVEEYVRIAREQVQMGVDSICIKDMAGILSPISAEKLVSALVAGVKVPIQLHCHATSGMAVATYVEGVRAGAGAIDCAISVMSGSSSQPAAETMVSIFDETSYHASLDRDALRKICKHFTDLAPQRQLSSQPLNPIDPEILIHHIPGGMISNLRSQLEQQDALDRLPEVLAELPRTRADLGYPPLVTPTSQIVGVQSVMNVLAGERYAMVPQETRNYVKGLYGKSPAPIDPKVARKILGKEKPITCRPADLLEPILPKVTLEIEDPTLINAEEDIIAYCIFPEPAMEYFRWRALPTEERPPIPADLERKKENAPPSASPSAPAPAAKPFLSDHDYAEIRSLMDRVGRLNFSEVTIRRNDLALSLKADGVRSTVTPQADAALPDRAAAVEPEPSVPDEETSRAEAEPVAEGSSVKAPLNGTFYLSSGPGKPPLVKAGDTVAAGEPVCIVEAMKLFNQIKAPVRCRIVNVLAQHGQAVKKGEPLIAIEEL
jgi:oxaloacetate decarboxylase (Na+ extruding) subunit alpha